VESWAELRRSIRKAMGSVVVVILAVLSDQLILCNYIGSNKRRIERAWCRLYEVEVAVVVVVVVAKVPPAKYFLASSELPFPPALSLQFAD